MKKFKLYRKSIHSGLLLIIGALIISVGLFTPKSKVVIALFPVYILLNAIILLYNRREKKRPEQYFLILGLIGIIAFGIEVLASHTSIIFGEFQYMDALGIMAFGTPVILSFCWIIHVICIGAVLHDTLQNIFAKSTISSVLATMLHWLFNNAYTILDFWTKKDGRVPYQHVLTTSVFYFFLFLIFYSFSFRKKNKIAWLFIGIEVIFFSIIILKF